MSNNDFDVIVVGAGFAGLHLIHELRSRGLHVRAFERGADVGGTWYWNKYPGARCDAESIHYSYSFSPEIEQEWTWTEKYATQQEILSYAKYVADTLDVRRDITFNVSVQSAAYDAIASTWTVSTDSGTTIRARYLVMATGCLSSGRIPAIEGIDSFSGEMYHTGAWPDEDVDFTGKRVGVIGTGSSGIQAIPEIATRAEHLTVFQRTPSFSVPARNRPLDPETVAKVKANYPQLRERARWSTSGSPHPPSEPSATAVTDAERQATYESKWSNGGPTILGSFSDIMVDQTANATLAEFIRGKIDDIVDDPEVARVLKPQNYPVGAKRICVDTNYYSTFNRDNVSLVDLRSTPIERVTESGIDLAGGHRELDMIVFATGYDAITGALDKIDITGRDGRALKDVWQDGPQTYLGIAIHGFPNLFLVTGPGSPSVLGNVLTSIEQHVEWISAHIDYLERHGITYSEARLDAQQSWVQTVNAAADSTLYPQAASWYTGANVPGKPRVFMPYVGGVGRYRHICDDIATNGYRGFDLVSPGAAE